MQHVSVEDILGLQIEEQVQQEKKEASHNKLLRDRGYLVSNKTMCVWYPHISQPESLYEEIFN